MKDVVLMHSILFFCLVVKTMEFRDKVERVKSLSIVSVLQDFGVRLNGRGNVLSASSPFRTDSSKTSFTISVSKNIFRDWTLGIGGDVITFVQQSTGMDFKQTVDYLHDRYFGIAFDEKPKVNFLRTVSQGKTIEKLSEVDLHQAYSIFLDMCKLSKEDLSYLKENRSLNDSEIKQYGFKSYPDCTKNFRIELTNKLRNAGIDITKVPGLFQFKDGKLATFKPYKGIIIPVINENRKIVGLQIRKAKLQSKDENRYMWFSSSFTEYEPDKYNAIGRSPGTPISVVQYNGDKTAVKELYITEGIFKAIAINKAFGAPAVSVQGITNWKDVIEALDTIKKEYPNLQTINIAFDADFITNDRVSEQMIKMSEAISEQSPNLNCIVSTWNVGEGKGIDDLINAVSNPQRHITELPMSQFKQQFFEKQKEEPSSLLEQIQFAKDKVVACENNTPSKTLAI